MEMTYILDLVMFVWMNRNGRIWVRGQNFNPTNLNQISRRISDHYPLDRILPGRIIKQRSSKTISNCINLKPLTNQLSKTSPPKNKCSEESIPSRLFINFQVLLTIRYFCWFVLGVNSWHILRRVSMALWVKVFLSK